MTSNDTSLRSTAEMAAQFNAHFDVARFDGWVQTAQPGAMTIYGCGVSASQDSPPGVADRLRALEAAGLVRLFHRRATRFDGNARYAFDFIVQRTARPCPKAFPKVSPLAVLRTLSPYQVEPRQLSPLPGRNR